MPRLPRRRRRRLSPSGRFALRAALVLLGIVLVLGAVATVRLLLIARDLREARDLISTAAAEIRATEIDAAEGHLDEAQRILARANGDLFNSIELDVIGWAPVVSQNLTALRDAVRSGLTMVGGAGEVLEVVGPLVSDEGRLEIPIDAGRVPLATVSATNRAVQNLLTDLPPPEQRPGGPLLGPVRRLQDTVYEEAAETRERLTVLSRALRLLSDMAGTSGDRRYLLAVANTAEMRGSGGMVLSYGVLEASDGQFDLTAFGPIDDLFLRTTPDPRLVPIADDEEARWPGLEPTRLFRNANLIPDFGIVGPRLASMYEQAVGLPVHGVVQVDAHGLAAILEGIGPVDVPGIGTVTAENVVDLTLNQIYFQFTDENDQRREVLGEIAEAAFERLTSGDLGSLRILAEALARAAAQRHLILYADTADASAAARQLGVDGALPAANAADALLFTLQNMGRDKLDYYIDTEVRVTGSRPGAEFGDVEVTIAVTNHAPADMTSPSYVFGRPEERAGVPAGTYVGVGSLYVPNSSSLTGSSGDATTQPVLTSENGRTVVGFDVQVPPGATATVTLRVQLAPRPPGPYSLVLAPFPRVRPTSWEVAVDDGEGRIARRAAGPLLTPEGVAADDE